jgi:hypothetical protein
LKDAALELQTDDDIARFDKKLRNLLKQKPRRE